MKKNPLKKKRKQYASSNGTYLRRHKNYQAFYAVLESYALIKLNSVVKVMDTSDIGGGTPNPATPSTIDFTVDVDSVVSKVLETKDLTKFYESFILGLSEYDKETKFKYEQRIGRLFIARQIWPVKKYFTVQRRKVEGNSSKT